MFLELRNALRPGLTLLLLFTALTGLAYPALVTVLAQLALPQQANGSLIADKGVVIGSALIGQNFAAPGSFHPRPSAAGKGYDASNSSATNLAPGSKALRDAVAMRVAAARKDGAVGPIPGDLVTSSASGLDPDISPEAALAQVSRIAAARHIDAARLRDLIAAQTQSPLLGLIGEAHVNVLLLNRQLDRIGAKPAA